MPKPTSLQRGGNASLAAVGANVDRLRVRISWKRNASDEGEMDVDASAFLLNEDKKVPEDTHFIFYNQPSFGKGAVVLEAQEGDAQTFNLNLSLMPTSIQAIAFSLTLYEAGPRGQDFGQLKELCVFVGTQQGEDALVFPIESTDGETALILGELYLHRQEWKFRAVGQGFRNGLEALAENFGVKIEAKAAPAPEPSPRKPEVTDPIVARYMEAIRDSVQRFQIKASKAQHERINESGTRLLIDSVLQQILGYGLQHIKTEQRIPGRRARADYLLAMDGENRLVVEAKAIGEKLTSAHVSQATSYAYYLNLHFAVLTNGIQWEMYYVERKKIKKYRSHPVFSINLMEFNEKAGRCLFDMSRFGFMKGRFQVLELKMKALSLLDEMILEPETLDTLARLSQRKCPEARLLPEEIAQVLEKRLASD
jgi:stress response protein SCP2